MKQDLARIEQFLDALWLEKNLAENTLNAYRRDLSMMVEWLHHRGLTLATAQSDDLQALLAERLEGGYKATSSARLLSAVRRLFQYLYREKFREDDPSAHLASPKLPQRLPKDLSEAQVERLLQAPLIDQPLELRDKAMLEVLYATGLRVSELVGLTMSDISDENQVVAMFTAIDQHDEPLAALVNNAGILFTQCTVENLTAERINRVLSTNVTGYFLCCREAVKRMALKNGGSGGAIVNVSSVASRLGSPGEYVDYAASKGAIDTLTTGLSLEVAAQGIRVNCVRPGFIYTEMHASGGEPGRVDRVKSNIPMQRGGQAEEVAQAIVWLLSDKASYVTGSFIDLAGGK